MEGARGIALCLRIGVYQGEGVGGNHRHTFHFRLGLYGVPKKWDIGQQFNNENRHSPFKQLAVACALDSTCEATLKA
jgi:hypothetical protein